MFMSFRLRRESSHITWISACAGMTCLRYDEHTKLIEQFCYMSIQAINNAPISKEVSAPLKPQKPNDANSFQKILNKEIKATESKIHNAPKMPSSPSEIRSHMNHLKNTNPPIRTSYNNTVDSINSKHLDENGMKIALKELAKQFENQIQSILWHQMFKKEGVSMAEKLWSSERTSALIDAGDDELGDIGEAVYEQLLEEMKLKNLMSQKQDNAR